MNDYADSAVIDESKVKVTVLEISQTDLDGSNKVEIMEAIRDEAISNRVLLNMCKTIHWSMMSRKSTAEIVTLLRMKRPTVCDQIIAVNGIQYKMELGAEQHFRLMQQVIADAHDGEDTSDTLKKYTTAVTVLM